LDSSPGPEASAGNARASTATQRKGASDTSVGAITTQAFVNPTLKALGLRLLGLGHPAAQVLELLRGADSDFEFRQVALVDRNGQVACHTGSRTRPWAGHQIGDGFAALGNVLKGEAVAAAMAEAFFASTSGDLAERLMAQSRPDAPVASTGSTAHCRSALRTCSCMRRTRSGDRPQVDSHPTQ
jgi:hypothetical protein